VFAAHGGNPAASPLASTGDPVVASLTLTATLPESGSVSGRQTPTLLSQLITSEVGVLGALANPQLVAGMNSNFSGSGNAARNPAGDFLALYPPGPSAASRLLFPGGLAGSSLAGSLPVLFPSDQGSLPDSGDDLFVAIGRGLPIGPFGSDRLNRADGDRGPTPLPAIRTDEATLDKVFTSGQYSRWGTILADSSLPAVETGAGPESRPGDGGPSEDGNAAPEIDGAVPAPLIEPDGSGGEES